MSPQASSRIIKFNASLIPTFVRILSKKYDTDKDLPTYSVETKTNALTLLKMLAESDAMFATQVSTTVGPVLEVLGAQSSLPDLEDAEIEILDSNDNPQVIHEPTLPRVTTSSFKLNNHVSKRELDSIFAGSIIPEKVKGTSLEQALFELMSVLNTK